MNVLEIPSALDIVEREMAERWPVLECHVEHSFIPGFYVRTITMPKGLLGTSKIHRTRHPFWITKGTVHVWTDHEGTIVLEAPHVGITEPGTRRLLYVEEETVWTTFHATDKQTVEEVAEEIIEPHVNPFPEVNYADVFGHVLPQLKEES